MLVSMKEMLADAKAKKYAIPAFDISNYEMMKAVLDTCEELGSPALLQGLPIDFNGRYMNLLCDMVKGASAHYNIPICLHLDHAPDIDCIKAGIKAGFSSVMLDASVLEFSENAKKSKEVVDYAHKYGITVEAELGHVGNASVGSISETGADVDPGESLTVPEEVKKFVDITDVDALAVAIGTAHGVYKSAPKLDVQRLSEIRRVVEVPLVLHGASGLTDDSIRACVREGICKVNFATELRIAYTEGVREVLNADGKVFDPKAYGKAARAKVKELVKNRMTVCGCNGKA